MDLKYFSCEYETRGILQINCNKIIEENSLFWFRKSEKMYFINFIKNKKQHINIIHL